MILVNQHISIINRTRIRTCIETEAQFITTHRNRVVKIDYQWFKYGKQFNLGWVYVRRDLEPPAGKRNISFSPKSLIC